MCPKVKGSGRVSNLSMVNFRESTFPNCPNYWQLYFWPFLCRLLRRLINAGSTAHTAATAAFIDSFLFLFSPQTQHTICWRELSRKMITVLCAVGSWKAHPHHHPKRTDPTPTRPQRMPSLRVLPGRQRNVCSGALPPAKPQSEQG